MKQIYLFFTLLFYVIVGVIVMMIGSKIIELGDDLGPNLMIGIVCGTPLLGTVLGVCAYRKDSTKELGWGLLYGSIPILVILIVFIAFVAYSLRNGIRTW